MVLVDSHGISRVPRYSGTCPASQSAVVYRAVTVSGRSFQIVRLADWFVTRRPCGQTGPTTPPCKHDGLGSSAFARRYWRNHFCFLFQQVLRWFTSLRCLHTAYEFSGGSFGINQRGFPHSEIPGSKLICSSPGLIAAYRVLHRLLAPRHSPYALSSLTIRNSTYADWLWALGFGLQHVRAKAESLEPEARLREPYAHCVCVVGKTTVCKIFNCQRTSWLQ